MTHVVLLGDSIFDNAAYVPGQPDVIRQLRTHLSDGARATLCAVDGDVVASVHAQLRNVPDDATHLVLSVGGNNALGHFGIVDERVSSSAQTLTRLADIRDDFAQQYLRLIGTILQRDLPLAVCTIYEGALPDPALHRVASTALTVFNDVIIRAAALNALPIIDLRLICDEPEDYANPIEPSAIGGDKISRAIAALLREGFGGGRCVIQGEAA